jgi:hypothetical protein
MQITEKPHLSIVEFDPDVARLEVTCPSCDSKRTLSVDFNSLHHWVTGSVLVQRAFPDLSDTDREALITGICDTCWGD